MSFRIFGISFTIFCLAGLPVDAGEQQSESSRLKQEITDQIDSSNQLDPVCLDEFKPVAKVLQLIDQKKQCFKLPTDIFDFKKDASSNKQLTISELAKITLEINPNIKAYEKNYQAYIYSSRAAWADAFDFDISGVATPSRVYTETYTKDLINTYNYSFADSVNTEFSGSVTLSMNLIDLAEIYNAKASAEEVTYGRAELQEEAIDTVQAAASSFVDYWYYDRLSKIYLDDIFNSVTSLTLAYGLYEIGQTSVSNLAQILSSLRASQTDYLNNLVSLNTAINNLRRYLNDQEINYYIPDQLEIDDIPINLAEYSELFINERLALDPSNIQNASSAKQYQYLSKSEIMNYVPTISASASISPTHQYGTTKTSAYSNMPGVTKTTTSQLEDEVDISAQIQLTWNFFDGFSSLNQSKSYSKTSKYYLDLFDNRSEELIALSRNYISSNNLYYRQIDFFYSEVQASEFNYDKTIIAFTYGFDDTTSLIQSLSELSSARQSQISNLYNYYVNYLNLNALFQTDIFNFTIP